VSFSPVMAKLNFQSHVSEILILYGNRYVFFPGIFDEYKI